ncbi:MAG TPA: hypothetical protein VFV19_14360 [Candidatus Polarisedimenticolaceae bacterium]|nr:hypothetical protein [Candidatus Polarisedimenticolaceae bacterium]
MSALDDLILWNETKAAGPARERVEDALRPSAVAAAVARAAGSPEERAEARLAVHHYLKGPLEERLRAARPHPGVDAALAAEEDPVLRRAIAFEHASRLGRLEGLVSERDAARDEAARLAGAEDARTLVLALRDPEAVAGADEAERGFVAPTDAAVEEAVHAWALREGLDEVTAADAPRMAFLADRSRRAPDVPAGPFVRRVADDLKLRGAVAGGGSGPTAIALALDALGRSLHATFLREARGPRAVALADPAFEVAAGSLFRGLLATAAGLRAAGLPDDPAVLQALRVEKLVETRRAWGELRSAARPAERRVLGRRTGGRPLSPEEAETADLDLGPGDASLTGRMFAALLEERLRTRFGNGWFARSEAGTYLRDLWAAEVEATPRRMAEALALGTMDSAPLIESCSPTKGRPS